MGGGAQWGAWEEGRNGRGTWRRMGAVCIGGRARRTGFAWHAFLWAHGHMGIWGWNPLPGTPPHVFPPPPLPADCKGPGGAGLRSRPPPGQGCWHLRRRRFAPPRHRLCTLLLQVRALHSPWPSVLPTPGPPSALIGWAYSSYAGAGIALPSLPREGPHSALFPPSGHAPLASLLLRHLDPGSPTLPPPTVPLPPSKMSKPPPGVSLPRPAHIRARLVHNAHPHSLS